MLIYHLLVTLFLVQTLGFVGLNLRVFTPPPRRRPDAIPGPLPLVSVLVPARNEAGRIGPCLDSLLAQDYPRYELLVLDDHSEDETAALVRARGMVDEPGPAAGDGTLAGPGPAAAASLSSSPPAPTPRRALLRGAPLPAGWTGKAWACHQLARAARGEYLLFTDADTTHGPDSVAALLDRARSADAALLSAWPFQVTRTWSERLIIPFIYVLILGLLPLAFFDWLQGRPDVRRRLSPATRRAFGAANGQCLLFRRAAYEQIGGHAAVRGHLVEDMALARLVAARAGEGFRLVNCDGSGLVSCRMYRSFPELWEGFSKNLRAVFDGPRSLVWFWFSGLVQFGAFVLPFILLAAGGFRSGWAWTEVGLIYLLRLTLTRRFRTAWLSCWAHPFGHALALVIALNSWRLSARRGVRWKGRTYQVAGPVEEPRAQEPTGW